MTLRPRAVNIGAAAGGTASDDVWLVRYDPNVVEVPVGRGENTCRTLPHTHVVHGLQLLGSWNGSAVSFDVAPAPAGYKTAVLVQAPNGGPILGATTD